MEEAISVTEKIQRKCMIARKEGVLFDSRLYQSDTGNNFEAVAQEDEDFERVTEQLGRRFTTSVFIGKVNLLGGEHRGYKFCDSFKDLEDFMGRFPHVVIRQKGSRIFFTLIGYTERHEMELRRLSKEGRMEFCDDLLFIFTEGTFQFVKRNSKPFGRIDPHVKYNGISA